LITFPFDKRKPIQQETDGKDEESPFEHFLPEYAWSGRLEPGHYKSHGITHGK
jgi:hypothetical protein